MSSNESENHSKGFTNRSPWTEMMNEIFMSYVISNKIHLKETKNKSKLYENIATILKKEPEFIDRELTVKSLSDHLTRILE